MKCVIFLLAATGALAQIPQPADPARLPPVPDLVAPIKPGWQRPTLEEKFKRYTNRTFGPTSMIAPTIFALQDQLEDYVPEWEQGMEGYSRRVMNRWGRFAVRNTIQFGFDSMLGIDSRYYRSQRSGIGARVWHALKYSVLSRADGGGTTIAIPRLAGAYGAGLITTTWYPSGHDSLMRGLERGHTHMAMEVGRNLLREFWPDIKRKIFRRNRSAALPLPSD